MLNIQVVATGSNTKLDPDNDESKNTDPYRVAKELGIYQEVEMTNPLCTDDVVSRIIENRLKYEKRNASRSKKEMAYIESRSYVAEISNKDHAAVVAQAAHADPAMQGVKK